MYNYNIEFHRIHTLCILSNVSGLLYREFKFQCTGMLGLAQGHGFSCISIQPDSGSVIMLQKIPETPGCQSEKKHGE